MQNYQFHQVNWSTAAGDIMELRKKIFVVEQRFDHEVVCDEFDSNSSHILVSSNKQEFIACGRLANDGRIGKIAVLINHRGNGIGTGILGKLIKIAEAKRFAHITLNTETDLVEFYDQQKFHAAGPVYMKEGIPYQRMTKRLA